MQKYYFENLQHQQLMKCFELERKEWSFHGMSEELIQRIHFGTKEEKGHGGDYRVWLDERRQKRHDHRYFILTDTQANRERVNIVQKEFADIDFKMDFEAALMLLTEMQRFCFISVKLKCRTEQSVADELGTTHQNVHKHIRAAVKKLKKFFEDRV